MPVVSRRPMSSFAEIEQFALVSQHLPLSDIVIARVLDTDRRKFINLHKAAGDRLSRRLTAPTRPAMIHTSPRPLFLHERLQATRACSTHESTCQGRIGAQPLHVDIS